MAMTPEIDDTVSIEAVTIFGTTPNAIEELAHSRKMTLTESVHRIHTPSGSAVVKVLAYPESRGWNGSRDPSHPWYWLREAWLYDSGIPRQYGEAHIAAPALLKRFDRTDGSIALWLEDLQGLPGSEWAAANYEAAARRLGRAQGPYLTDVVEEHGSPWSRHFLAGYFAKWDDVGWDRIHDSDAWETDLIRSHFSPRLRSDLMRLCAQRHTLIGWAELLPQTICHHDVWVNNTFDFEDHTTLIDWAFAGHGQVGADVGNLVSDSCGDLLHPTASLPAFDAAATTGYREGLREAGWVGDFRLARLGMCLMAAKWSWLVPWMLQRAIEEDHQVYGGVPVDSDYLFSERAAMLEFFTIWADEATILGDELGFPSP